MTPVAVVGVSVNVICLGRHSLTQSPVEVPANRSKYRYSLPLRATAITVYARAWLSSNHSRGKNICVAYMTQSSSLESGKKKRAKPPKTMQMSLAYLKGLARIPDIAERKLVRPGQFPITKDLFGLFDIVYVEPAGPVIGFVQTSSWGGKRARIMRLEQDNRLVMDALLKMPAEQVRVELHAWYKDDAGEWEVSVWRAVPSLTGDPDMIEIESISAKIVRRKMREEENARQAKHSQGSKRVIQR